MNPLIGISTIITASPAKTEGPATNDLTLHTHTQNDTKKYSFPQRSIYTWNGLKKEVITAKKCTPAQGKVANIDTETGPQKCTSGPVYYN